MHLMLNVKRRMRHHRNQPAQAIGSIGLLLLSIALAPVLAVTAEKSPPVKIAVFDFELEDVSAAASAPGETEADLARLKDVSSAARRELAQSGRYSLIDVSKVGAVTQASLRNCDGCDAGIALRLGAEQSFVGVLRRVSRTEYAVLYQIRDARTGKILNQQEAPFLGSDEGWASGVASLLRHRLLAGQQ
jgi:hypothetical protein